MTMTARLDSQDFDRLVRQVFDDTCRENGIEPTDELFEKTLKEDVYFRQQVQKLKEKNARVHLTPLARAVKNHMN